MLALALHSPSDKRKGWFWRSNSSCFCKWEKQIRKPALQLASASKVTLSDTRSSSSALSCFLACSVRRHQQRCLHLLDFHHLLENESVSCGDHF